MALSFPRAMPTGGVARQTLEISRVDFQTPEVGGRMTSIGIGFPLWRLELELGSMGSADGDAWRAFVASLRGSSRSFYGRDLMRSYPKAHQGGIGGFSGDASSWSVNATRDVLTLNLPGAAAGLQLGLGDLVGFRWSTDKRTVARVVEAGSAAGGALTCSIEPPLPSLVPGAAIGSVYGAEVVMRLITDQTTVGPESSLETQGGRIVAMQDLRP